MWANQAQEVVIDETAVCEIRFRELTVRENRVEQFGGKLRRGREPSLTSSSSCRGRHVERRERRRGKKRSCLRKLEELARLSLGGKLWKGGLQVVLEVWIGLSEQLMPATEFDS